MENLVLERTSNTPAVFFDPHKGMLRIEGRSIPENPGEFYDSLLTWIQEYFKAPAESTEVNLNLEYVNSGSSKFLLSIFKFIREQYKKGHKVVFNWYYEEDDEAILGLGEHYQTSLKMPFNLVEYI